MTQDRLTYKDSGVDYDRIDPLKVLAQKAARTTGVNLEGAGVKEVAASRGESAYVVDIGDAYLASITECLGTKALVADAVREVSERTWYDQIAQDTIATAVNDIVTVGARPLSIHAYWAAGSSDWFDDEARMNDLVSGWKAGLRQIGRGLGRRRDPVPDRGGGSRRYRPGRVLRGHHPPEVAPHPGGRPCGRGRDHPP